MHSRTPSVSHGDLKPVGTLTKPVVLAIIILMRRYIWNRRMSYFTTMTTPCSATSASRKSMKNATRTGTHLSKFKARNYTAVPSFGRIRTLVGTHKVTFGPLRNS